jgi:TnpA family transposase
VDSHGQSEVAFGFCRLLGFQLLPRLKAIHAQRLYRPEIFLCQYLHSESLRQEIQEGLNVIENWNGTNNFILYGKGGEIASNDLENQEITMLALHLLQISLVYINTLMIQRILGEPNWTQRMTPEDLRALTPLIDTHVTPYGMFRLDMNKRLDIDAVRATA